MLFLREYNIEVGCNPLEPGGSFSCLQTMLFLREYNIEVGFNGLIQGVHIEWQVTGKESLLFEILKLQENSLT